MTTINYCMIFRNLHTLCLELCIMARCSAILCVKVIVDAVAGMVVFVSA